MLGLQHFAMAAHFENQQVDHQCDDQLHACLASWNLPWQLASHHTSLHLLINIYLNDGRRIGIFHGAQLIVLRMLLFHGDGLIVTYILAV